MCQIKERFIILILITTTYAAFGLIRQTNFKSMSNSSELQILWNGNFPLESKVQSLKDNSLNILLCSARDDQSEKYFVSFTKGIFNSSSKGRPHARMLLSQQTNFSLHSQPLPKTVAVWLSMSIGKSPTLQPNVVKVTLLHVLIDAAYNHLQILTSALNISEYNLD